MNKKRRKNMTEQDKKLLIVDLCGRLSYGGNYIENDGVNENDNKLLDIDMFDGCINYDYIIEDIKPYLRPISSMTEKEKKEFDKVLKSCNDKVFACPDKERRYNFFDAEQEDFMNAHHFDHRGLIEKGLALVAPEGMYKK